MPYMVSATESTVSVFKKAVEDRGITVIYSHRVGKVQVNDRTVDSPTRKEPIAMNESIAESEESRVNPVHHARLRPGR